MPYYYRQDGRWLEVPYTSESVQEFPAWHSDGKRLYQLLTAERCERLKAWCKENSGKVADSLRRLIEEFDGAATENTTENQAAEAYPAQA
jgi:hypothetical protein